MIYNYFRDYDPSIGRYIQSDPLGLAAGINTYGYVEESPLTKVDLLGLESDTLDGRPRPPGVPDVSAEAQRRLAQQLTDMLRQLRDKLACSPEPDDPCSKEQRRIEQFKKFCRPLQLISASGYRACAVPINEYITQHNLFCPKNRVEKLPLPGPRSVP